MPSVNPVGFVYLVLRCAFFVALVSIGASRGGSRPKLTATQQIRPIAKLLFVMAACAVIAGLTGFVLTRRAFLAAELDYSSVGFIFLSRLSGLVCA
jgi:hypothetical protein